jgi:hypothetical protein
MSHTWSYLCELVLSVFSAWAQTRASNRPGRHFIKPNNFLLVIIVLLLCACVVSAQEEPRERPHSILPDYEREAVIVFHGSCDEGEIRYITYYKRGGYILEIALTKSNSTFYMMKRYIGEAAGWSQRYFVKTVGSLNVAELAHEEWDERVKDASVNYFNKLHDLKSHCSKIVVA